MGMEEYIMTQPKYLPKAQNLVAIDQLSIG